MKTENEICESMEKQALLEQGVALKDWQKHAEDCPNCHSRLEIIEKLQRVAGDLDESLGVERFEVIRQAVTDREKKVGYYPLLQYAALILLLLVCVFVFKLIQQQEVKTITKKQQPELLLNKTELAWDFEQDTDALQYKINKLKRKVYFSDLRNEDTSSFKLKCRTIKKQTYKLKSAKQI